MTSTTQQAQAAAIAVVAPLNKTLSYAIPADLMTEVRIGSRVRVPLGRRQVVGYVMGWMEPGDAQLEPGDAQLKPGDAQLKPGVAKLKNILEVIDPHPLFHANH
ncbi:MAG: hypothetical protein KAU27_07250, partial [Desulfuromonadales bacterium]|nr:hypothetical protein [Desulfuromonadales bacterium]